MAFNLGYLCAFSMIVTVLFLAPLILELGSLVGPTIEKQQAAVQLLYLHARILPTFVVALAVFAVHGLFFSHRIAGPLYRFKQIFRSVAAGEVPRGVHLRDKDYLRPEAQELGKMLTGLRSRLGDIHAERACVERGWCHLDRAMRTGNGDDIDFRLNDLKDRIEALSVQISRFDIGAANSELSERAEWSTAVLSVDQVPPVVRPAPESATRRT